MYKHLVFWKLKEFANGMSNTELRIEVKKRLDELPSHISEIVSYETAINIGNYGASFFDVSVISSFKSEADFWAYTKYPVHDKVVSFIQSIQIDEQIVDYEV